MAKGISAMYTSPSSSRDKQEIVDDDDDIIVDTELNSEINDIILKRLHCMGLLLTKETSSSLVLIIANSPHCQFDLEIQSADHVDIMFHGERPPSSLFHDLQEFIGLTPEEWGLEANETLLTSVSIFPTKPLSTDKSKITRKGYPPQLPLHYIVNIPFYVEQHESNLHFDKLVIPNLSGPSRMDV